MTERTTVDARVFSYDRAREIDPHAGLEETLRKAKQISDYVERGVVPTAPEAK